jgi:hypothetical protein
MRSGCGHARISPVLQEMVHRRSAAAESAESRVVQAGGQLLLRDLRRQPSARSTPRLPQRFTPDDGGVSHTKSSGSLTGLSMWRLPVLSVSKLAVETR